MNNKQFRILILLIICISVAAGVGGYFFFRSYPGPVPITTVDEIPEEVTVAPEDLITLQIFYPIYTRLHMVEKRVPKRKNQLAIAEAVLDEFFKGFGDGKISHLPRNVTVLGLYRDVYNILYIDLSDELRTNFQGDALSEYLLLKGLYESLISNLQDFSDFKILIEGKEIETLGGHFYLKYTLKNVIT
jgi:hypothetical protein